MTKKDYILIADSLYRSIQITTWLEKNQVRKQTKLAAYRSIAHDLAGSLKGDNPKFNQDKFLKACGVAE